MPVRRLFHQILLHWGTLHRRAAHLCNVGACYCQNDFGRVQIAIFLNLGLVELLVVEQRKLGVLVLDLLGSRGHVVLVYGRCEFSVVRSN